MGQYDIAYGNKYESTKDLSRAEIAKLIRQDIKAAVVRGEIPRAKFSVKCRSFAGGGSIDVKISDVAKPGFVLCNAGRIRWDLENPHKGHFDCPSDFLKRLSKEADAFIKTVEAIVGAYNFDGSDSMTDYFHVRFYGHVDFESRWERETTEREIEAARTALMRCQKHDDCRQSPELAAACFAAREAPKAPEAPVLEAPKASTQEDYLAALGG